MRNLIKEITKLNTKRVSDKIKAINNIKNVSEFKSNYYLSSTLTKYTLSKLNDYSLDELKAKATDKTNKDYAKALTEELTKVDTVANFEYKVNSLVFSIDWKKSNTWGYCPKGYLSVIYTNGVTERFETGSITGCGYDKESTATAQLLNQSNAVLKMLYTKKNMRNRFKKSNSDALGYGSGYGILPAFEGGVGQASINNILINLGFKCTEQSERNIVFSIK